MLESKSALLPLPASLPALTVITLNDLDAATSWPLIPCQAALSTTAMSSACRMHRGWASLDVAGWEAW